MSHPGMTPVVTKVTERGAGEYEARIQCLQWPATGSWCLTGELPGGDRCDQAAGRGRGPASRVTRGPPAPAHPRRGAPAAPPPPDAAARAPGRRSRARGARPRRPTDWRNLATVATSDPLARAPGHRPADCGQRVLRGLPDGAGARRGPPRVPRQVAMATPPARQVAGDLLLVGVLDAYELFDVWSLPAATAWIDPRLFRRGDGRGACCLPARCSGKNLRVPDWPVQLRGVHRVADRAARHQPRHVPDVRDGGPHQGAQGSPA